MAGTHKTICDGSDVSRLDTGTAFGAGVADAQAEVGTFFDQGREYR
jgi:hypothetical protein